MDKNIDQNLDKNGFKTHILEAFDEAPLLNTEFVSKNELSDMNLRAKTSQRIKYEAQVQVIKKQIGSLEMVRESLQLSRRKMCQLLMVDPSAWTRWVREGDAPPHIYRSLQWYLALNEKFPGLGNPYWLSSVSHGTSASRDAEYGVLLLNKRVESLEVQQVKLKNVLNLYKKISLLLFVFLLAALLVRYI